MKDENWKEELDEDDGLSNPGPSKRRKAPKNLFVELEASVDEESEEEEDDFEDDFVDERDMDEARSTYARLLNKKREHRREELDVVQEERRIQELYGRDVEYTPPLEIPEAFLKPSVKDPKLWLLSCQSGREKHLLSVLYRQMMLAREKDPAAPLPIKSIIARETLKGYIYIEAYRRDDFQAIIEGVSGLFSTKLRLVPISEMTEVLQIQEEKIPVVAGSWVRVRRGKYANDLAQVIDVDDVTGTCRIRLIPRVDSGDGSSRPPAKLFNPKRINERDKRNNLSRHRGYWIYNGEYFRDGYLEKDIRMRGLVAKNVIPTLDELGMFSASDKVTEQDVVRQEEPTKINKGDTVRVVGGDLITMIGQVETTAGSNAVISTENPAGIRKSYSVPLHHLRKYFKIGDGVNVISGSFRGAKGLVVGMNETTVAVFDVGSGTQIEVFPKDLGGSTASVDEVPSARQESSRQLGRRTRPVRDPMTGKTVIICGGSFKGQMGIVKEGDATGLTVELHCNCQNVTVDRNHIKVFGEHEDPEGGRTPGYGGATPGYGGRTPGYGGATPGYGGRTPGYGGATPRYRRKD